MMSHSLPFPPGANPTDTTVNGVHFNLTTLKHWNYTLYANETLSNESNCWLAFEPYTPPLLFSNGTFVNATSCYVPIRPLRAQGITGLIFGVLFAASIVFTLMNLRKHGRSFLLRNQRWSVASRRWQWYWMLFVAVCGTISAMTGIDVDRDYLQSTALMLRSFFYTLMFPGMIACVWETARHRNSWQERQLCDADPFALRAHDLRSKKEFYMPLVFYLFDWLVFFMTIPRSWTALQKQRSATQAEEIARPMTIDARFRTGGVFACCALVVICYCVQHTRYYYSQGVPQASSILKGVPLKLVIAIPIAAVRIGYGVASAWDWSISPYRADVGNGWLYGLGNGPALLLLVVLNICGFIEENDDRLLIAQRVRRSRTADQELGILRASIKPSWWSKSHTQAVVSAEEMLREMAFHSSGKSITTSTSEIEEDHSGRWWWQKREGPDGANGHRVPSARSTSSTNAYTSSTLELPDSTTSLRLSREVSVSESEPSFVTWHSKPQIVRSLLDV